MIEPNDLAFVRLISALAEPSAFTDPWSSQPDDARASILKRLRQLPSSDARKFLQVLTDTAPPDETSVATLRRAHRAAAELLPYLLKKYQELLDAESRETAHDKFVQAEAAYDPFLEGTTLLTRDAYAGRGDLEPDPPTVLDAWGNVVSP